LSDYKNWKYRNKAEHGIIFPENIGTNLSIDETCLSHGELYTVLSNKSAKGKKGTIVAILKGTHSDSIIPLLENIPLHLRKRVREITLDLAGSMGLIVKKCFPHASMVIDRFHVQQLATEALQEIRIRCRWEAIEAENIALDESKTNKKAYLPEILNNGETLKQMLARSRY
jgi:transposase